MSYRPLMGSFGKLSRYSIYWGSNGVTLFFPIQARFSFLHELMTYFKHFKVVYCSCWKYHTWTILSALYLAHLFTCSWAPFTSPRKATASCNAGMPQIWTFEALYIFDWKVMDVAFFPYCYLMIKETSHDYFLSKKCLVSLKDIWTVKNIKYMGIFYFVILIE